MEDLPSTLKQAMEKDNISIRALENKIAERFERNQRVSRNLIHEYLTGKRAPTYEAAYVLATVLEIDTKELLTLTYLERQLNRSEAERQRFLAFCKENDINIKTLHLI